MRINQQQVMMRKLAVLAAVQYMARDLDGLEIDRDHIDLVYNLERYSRERIEEMSKVLGELFHRC